MREGNFSVCPHFWGGGVPHPRSGWGIPHPADGGYPIPGLNREVPHPADGGVPPFKTGWGTPHSGLDGVSPDWMGYPPVQDWMGYPPRHQSKHLLRGGRCASCVHPGGLSCTLICLQTGTLCELNDTTHCEPCEKCLELERLNSNLATFLNPSCQECVLSVHYISNYANVLNKNTPYTCKKVLPKDVVESADGQDNFSD